MIAGGLKCSQITLIDLFFCLEDMFVKGSSERKELDIQQLAKGPQAALCGTLIHQRPLEERWTMIHHLLLSETGPDISVESNNFLG
jgi:hypothetical protein